MEGDVIVIRCFGFSRPGLNLSSLHCDQCAFFFKDVVTMERGTG